MRKTKVNSIKYFPSSGYFHVFGSKRNMDLCYDYMNNEDITFSELGKKYGISADRCRIIVAKYNEKFKYYFLYPEEYKKCWGNVL